MQNLSIHLQSKLVYGAFGKKDAVSVVVACVRGHSREKLAKEFGIAWHAFDTKDFHCNVRFMTMAELCFVDFKVQEYRDILVAISHCIQLLLFEVQGKG